MKCDGCPFHKYEVGLEDADEWCDVFGDISLDEKRSRKDETGCRYNMRTLAKFKRDKDKADSLALMRCYAPKE